MEGVTARKGLKAIFHIKRALFLQNTNNLLIDKLK